MRDASKTKEQLIDELMELRQQNAELTVQTEAVRDVTNLLQNQKLLHESEERYRSIIGNIPDVIWTSDFDGRTVFISDNIEEVYGFSPEEIYQGGVRIWFGRIHADDADYVKQAYTLFFTEAKQFNIEYRIQREDGKWIWLHDRSIATYERDGTMYADGLLSDITERKRADEELTKYRDHLEELVQEHTEQLQQEIARRRQVEEELRERELRYRDVIALAGGVAYEHGPYDEETYSFMDEGIKGLTGYGPDEMTRELFDSLTEEIGNPEIIDSTGHELGLQTYGNEFTTYKNDRRIRTADGGMVWLADSSIDIRGSDGRILRAIGMLQDVTERRLAEETIRKERDKAQKYLDVAGVILVALDADGKVSLINKKGCTILGYKEEEIIGKNWFDSFLSERPGEEYAKAFYMIMAGEIEPIKHYVGSILTGNGGEKIVSWHNTILTNSEGKITGIL